MIFILLPAYNEEEGLEKLLDRIYRIMKAFAIDYKLIIVNDGSKDRTVYVIKSYSDIMPIELIDFKQRKGITQVFRVGFKRVCEIGKDEDICIAVDSDNTMSPYVMLDMINQFNQSYEVVTASRFEKGGKMIGVPFMRKVMSICVAKLLRLQIPIEGVRDYSTFYRGYKVGVLKKAFEIYGDTLIEGRGFSSIAAMVIKLYRKITQKFTEVPLTLRYDLKEGGSGLSIPETIRGYLIVFWQLIRGKL